MARSVGRAVTRVDAHAPPRPRPHEKVRPRVARRARRARPPMRALDRIGPRILPPHSAGTGAFADAQISRPALALDAPLPSRAEFQHVHPGRGASFCRTKVRNYLNGNTKEETFRNGTTFEVPDITNLQMQYTYKDEEQYVFMDMDTFEECRCPPGEFEKFITEGMTCSVLQWDGKVIGVEPPEKVTLEVTMTDPGLKGNTASGGDKPATLETGLTVTVPLFINIGDKVVVSTANGGEYNARVKE